MMPENMLTAPEVAEYLKVKIETVYNLIRNSKLPAAKIGGQWRFRETELECWVQAQMDSGTRQSVEPPTAERPSVRSDLEGRASHDGF